MIALRAGTIAAGALVLLLANETFGQMRQPLGIVIGAEGGSGILVARVQPGSQAAAGGVWAGDLVVGLGRHHVTSVAQLRRAVDDHDGDTFGLKVRRNGTVIEILVPRDPEDARFRTVGVADRRCAVFCLVEEPRHWRECGCAVAACKTCNGCAL